MNILMVDDDQHLLDQAEVFLKHINNNFKIDTVGSGEQALKELGRNEYDVIVSDYQMPGMDGLELLDTVKNKRREGIPFIVFTGKGREALAMEALNLGADRYLHKGGDPRSQYGILAQAISQVVQHAEAETALRESEEKYRNLFNDAPIGIIQYDEEGIIKECNDKFNDFMASSKDILIGMNMKEKLENEGVIEGVKDSLEEGEGYFEGWYTSVTGNEKRYGRAKFKGLKNEDGEIDSGIGIVEDLSYEKETEKRMKDLNNMLRTIRNVNQVIVKEDDLEDVMKESSRIMNERDSVLGCSIALLDDSLIETFVSSGEQVITEGWSLSAKGDGDAPGYVKKAVRYKEIQIVDSSELDEYGLSEGRGQGVFTPMVRDERIIGLLIIHLRRLKEVTEEEKELLQEVANDLALAWEKMKLQKELEESEKKFRNLAQTTSTAIMVYQDDKWVYANPAAEEISGYSAEEMEGMKFWDFVAPEFKEKIKKRGKKRESNIEAVSGYEFKIITKQGEERWVYLEGTSTEYKGEPAGLISVMDVTERKKAEEALKESEEKYKSLFYETPIGTLRYNKDGMITECNDKFVEIIGSSRDKLVGLNMIEDLKDKNLIGEVKSSLEEGEGYYEGDYTSITADKTTSVRIIFKGIMDDDGDIYAGMGLIEDITERKEAQEALKESEKKYRRIIEHMDDVYYRADMEGNLVMASPSGKDMLGYEIDNIVGDRIESLYVNEEDRKEFLKEIERKGSIKNFETDLERKDGEVVHVLVNSHVIEDDDGDPVGIEGIISDISERKKYEEELKKAEHEKSLILDNIDEIISLHDTDHEVLWANKAYQEATGLSSEEIIGKKCYELWGLDERCNDCPAEKSLRTGKPEEADMTPETQESWTSKQGYWHVRAAPLMDDEDIIGVIEIAHDIEERKEKERRREFLHSILRHDIKNNLQLAKGYVQLLENDLVEENKHTGNIMDVLNQSEDIVKKVRTLHKIGKEGDIGEIEIGEVLDDILSDFEAILKAEDIVVDFGEIDCEVRSGTLLQPMVRNIIENSIKHSNCSSICISTEDENDACKLIISDDGKGVPDGLKEKIFQREFKYGDTGGTGLGLFLVKEIAESYGGSVKVLDSEGGGARFEIMLKKAD